MSSRNRRWLGAALLLGLLGLLYYSSSTGGQGPQTDVAADRPAAKAASAASGAHESAAWGLAAQADTEANRAEAAAAAEKAWLLDPRNDATWCQRGPSAVKASLTAYQRSSDDGANRPTGPAFDALNETTEALLQRWAAQLAARGDEDSLAMSDFLVAKVAGYDMQTGSFHKPGGQGLARAEHLLGMSRRSEQPFVLWLGASFACGDRQATSPTCKQVLERWIRVRPGSLDAMLWLLEGMPEGASEAAVDAVLARALGASDDSAHVLRYMGLLQSLLSDSGPPGLRQAAELKTMVAAQFSFELASPFALLDRCKEARSSELRGRCLTAAERVYDRDYQTTLLRMTSVAIARTLGSEDPRWTSRYEEVKQNRDWLRKDPVHGLDERVMEVMLTGSCQAEPLRQAMLDRMKHDELGLMKLAQARQRSLTPAPAR